MKKRIAKGAAKAKKAVPTLVELDRKLDIIVENMATKEDVADLRAEMHADFATKQELRQEIQALDDKFTQKFQELHVSIDGLMKPLSELKMEYTGMMIQLSRHEDWIKRIADKVGIKLSH